MKSIKLEIVRDLLGYYINDEQKQSKGDKHVYYSKKRPKKFK